MPGVGPHAEQEGCMTDRQSRDGTSRRAWLASVLMGAGLLASYGTLAAQVLSFLLPTGRSSRRRIFVGPAAAFPAGEVRTILDLEGNEVLVRRSAAGLRAFSSTCPHLGCKVHWQAEEERFFCPCHNGVFDADGVAVSGPPADAGQSLYPAPLIVDEENQVVYLEAKVPRRKGP